MLDRRGRIVETNRAAARLVGRRREELIGCRPARLLDRSTAIGWGEVITTVARGEVVESLSLRLRRSDGAVRDVLAQLVPLSPAAWPQIGLLVILRDESTRLALQHHLAQIDRLATTGRLAAGVAHEINNPLQSILVYLSLVESRLPQDFPEREGWRRICQGVERIRQIVSDLLDLHRGGERDRGPVDLHEIVKEALDLTHTVVVKRGIRVQRELTAESSQVCAGGKPVYQVTLNLLLNAIDAMPHGGTLGIRTRHAAGGQLELDVSDTGAGIPEAQLPHIFDPFLSAGTRTGTGLGLFVTFNLVREVGGKIRVDSVPGRGSVFQVAWPTALD
jgi:PAS domain S-box-containing protein